MKNYLELELYKLLRKDNTIFDFIQYTLLDGMWYWDLEHPENEWMNSRFWTTLGYDPKEMPHSPDAWQNIINKDDLAVALDNFHKHIEDENHPYDQEVRYTHKNGSTVWIRCYGKAIRDETGKPIRMIGLHLDITKLKNIQEEVLKKERAEEREKLLITTLDNLLEGCQIINFDWKYIYLNKTAAIHNQRPNSELLGKTYMDMWPGITETNVYQKIKSCLEERKLYHLETEFLFSTNEKRWFDLSIQPVEEGVFILSIDITKRKQSEIVLQRKNQELQRTQKITHVGSWYLDIATNEVTWTEELYKMYGFDPNLPPPPFNEHGKLFTPESWEILSTSLARTEETGIPYELELKTIRKDKSNGWMWVRGEAIFSQSGEIIGLWGAAQDITEHKEINEELKIAKENAEMNEFYVKEKNEEYESLNEELRQTNEELIIAKEKAEESDRLKTAFLQNMSHEIRTPMNAIIGFSALLADNLNDKEKLNMYTKIIEQRGSDLLDIINDLLDISKIESGQYTLNIGECNINNLFVELNLFFRDYQERTSKQHIPLLMQHISDEDIIEIRTDSVKLKQILINLITNAFKYTEAGSVQCGCRLENDMLLFYVTDTGIGIAPDKSDFIFERFTRIVHPDFQSIGGTGLGLSIVKGIVGLLGGKVWFESEPGKGTTFYFTIKYISSELKRNITIIKKKERLSLNSNKSLLIVEDDMFNSIFLQEILSKDVKNIFKVTTGTEAVNFMQTHTVDIIFMDVRLPDISGYDATKAILKIKPGIPIIAQTAYAEYNERQKALAAGCVDYISKPIKQADLRALLIKHLKKSAAKI